MKAGRLQKRERTLAGRGARDAAMVKKQEQRALEQSLRKAGVAAFTTPHSAAAPHKLVVNGLPLARTKSSEAMARQQAARERAAAAEAAAARFAAEQQERRDDAELAGLVLQKCQLLAATQVQPRTTAQGEPGFPFPTHRERAAVQRLHDADSHALAPEFARHVSSPWPTAEERAILARAKHFAAPWSTVADHGSAAAEQDPPDPHAALLLMQWATIRLDVRRHSLTYQKPKLGKLLRAVEVMAAAQLRKVAAYLPLLRGMGADYQAYHCQLLDNNTAEEAAAMECARSLLCWGLLGAVDYDVARRVAMKLRRLKGLLPRTQLRSTRNS